MASSPLSAGNATPPSQPFLDPSDTVGLELLVPETGGRVRATWRRLSGALGITGWPVAVYAFSRLVLLLVSGIAAIGGHTFSSGFFGFDGQWYLKLAEHGYPDQALHAKSTLGFFPLYPLVLRTLALPFALPTPAAALVTSLLGGMVAAILVHRLAIGWWGEQTARRATVAFCLFPGTIVFSMSYSECLTIPLAAGCLLAMRNRRWALAGILAALATTVEPVALVLLVVCAVVSLRELVRRGWHDPQARRSLAAPLLAPAGIAAFAVFLWGWTGTPMAAYIAQHYGWHEQTQPLALLTLPVTQQVSGHPRQVLDQLFGWNIWNGVFGAVFLACSIIVLVRLRKELSVGVLAMTAGIAAVTGWSVLTPPNARMILVAFPAVLVWGRRISGRAFGLFVTGETVLLVLMSTLTYSGRMLPLQASGARPGVPP